MNWRLFALPVVLGLGAFSSAQVDVHSILQEMSDLTHLSHRPAYPYKAAMTSSYDRASVTPGTDSWFANSDKGKYIRSEKVPGRTEYVMADLKGPGSVVRLWSANPVGLTLRFYFDGEKTPRMTVPMDSLLNGSLAPFTDPFAYIAAEGYNLYFPFPYSTSLKITVSGSTTSSLYYHVEYRTYAAGTPVTTYVPGSVTPAEMSTVGMVMQNPGLRTLPTDLTSSQISGAVKTTVPADLVLTGPGAVYELNIRVTPPPLKQAPSYTDSAQIWNVIRNLVLEVRFDGELCIQTPLGDFFGTAPGIHPYDAFPFSVAADGTMTCRLVMPFANTADIKIRNLTTAVSPTVSITAVKGSYAFDDGAYYLHSQWTVQKQLSRPLRDINLLSAQGEGLWIGDNLHIANVAGDWWGEGDEKVFVDGESFPSTFGTGSEDYFGYAWCSPTLFAKPYHGQSVNDYPCNYGNTNVHRWQIVDPIPYTSSLSFNIEAYSVNSNTSPTFGHTSYWYARPGGQAVRPLTSTLLLPPKVGLPTSLQGTMVQGEDIAVQSVSGGVLSVQTHQTSSLGYKTLLWHGGQPGDALRTSVTIPEAGNYKFQMKPRMSSAAGTVHVYVAGQDMGVFNLYKSSSGLSQIVVGTLALPAGPIDLEFDLQQRDSHSTDNDFVLDWVLFQKQ